MPFGNIYFGDRQKQRAAKGWQGSVKRALKTSGIKTRRHAGEGAAYAYLDDVLQLPSQRSKGWGGYTIHELAHATGHGSRTGRRGRQAAKLAGLDDYTLSLKSGREYAREEIVAELIAYRVGKKLGIPTSAGRTTTTRQYVREYTESYGFDNQPEESMPFGKGGRYGPRTSEEASSLMADVREGEAMVLSWAGGEAQGGGGGGGGGGGATAIAAAGRRGLGRARPQVGGGS